ncbi:MAG TPA: DUF2330 domain-containing protein [Kofleriaceae bacterium]|nr:DUF2330 domain-containing protein [Kofleriaceae bacterium]
MRTKQLVIAAIATAVAVAAVPRGASAFCGFYIDTGGNTLTNEATQVDLMRKGTRTVLSMQNNYKGPAEEFAMVVPVPVVLHQEDVKTLPRDVFDRVEKMGAPRLVEYWEQDPCAPPEPDYDMMPMAMAGAGMAAPVDEEKADLGVKIEAKFVVGEYQILVLSATDSTGLDTWLRREHYQIPPGAEPYLRPYVEAGMKFFVAKVDPKKVTFDADHRAALSPLRFHYDSDEFALPIRLGLANSSGTQDLIVSILAPHQRSEVANYKTVPIPTNLDVRDPVRGDFASFYAALFDRTLAKNPGAVVTEYAWQASTCDPCPGPNLDSNDFTLLGADVLEGPMDKPTAYGGWDFVLTRLHARYGKDLKDDLVFKAATPIVGGREFVVAGGKLEERSRPDATNNFQARYIIRHWWTGKITCASPRRGVWGGPPGGSQPQPLAATRLAFARRSAPLSRLVVKNIPELGVRAYRTRPKPRPRPAPAPAHHP